MLSEETCSVAQHRVGILRLKVRMVTGEGGGICRSIYLLQIWLMLCEGMQDAAAVATWYKARSIALSRRQFSAKSN